MLRIDRLLGRHKKKEEAAAEKMELVFANSTCRWAYEDDKRTKT